MSLLKSFWHFLVVERLGYRRPMYPGLDDYLLNHMAYHDLQKAEVDRLERLEHAVRYLDANMDLVRVLKPQGATNND